MKRATRRLTPQREDGVALVMALGVLFVLTIVLVSVISFSTSNAKDADHKTAGQGSYAVAEAGVNNALAQLATLYAPGNTTMYTSTYPSLVSSSGQSYSGGTASWSSSFTSTSTYGGYWTITATGTAPNPNGPNLASLRRTITFKVDVMERPRTVGTPAIWDYNYSGGTGSPCDMTIDQGVTFTAPLYMPGNLCLRNKGSILDPAKYLAVGGNIDIQNKNGSVGTSALPIKDVFVGGGCSLTGGASTNPCQNAPGADTAIWATNFTNGMPNPPLTLPTIDWSAMYDRARPGPLDECTKTSSGSGPDFENDTTPLNVSVPTFNLTPTTSYTCVAQNGGELSWNATTKVLTVNGLIFFDGNVKVDTGNGVYARYVGSATIYASGTVLIKNNSTLCAKLNGSACDWTNWKPGAGDGILTLVANGIGQGQVSAGDSTEVMQSSFQGALYGTNIVQIEQGSTVQGPIVTPDEIAPGQSAVTAFPSVIAVSAGTPGDTSPPEFMIGPPRDITY